MEIFSWLEIFSKFQECSIKSKFLLGTKPLFSQPTFFSKFWADIEWITMKGFGLGGKEVLLSAIQVIFVGAGLFSQGVAQRQEQMIFKGFKGWDVQLVDQHLPAQLKQLLTGDGFDVWSGIVVREAACAVVRAPALNRPYDPACQHSWAIVLMLGGRSSNSSRPLLWHLIDSKTFYRWSPCLAVVFGCPADGHQVRLSWILVNRTQFAPPVTTELSRISFRLNKRNDKTALTWRWRWVLITWWGTHFDSLDKSRIVLRCSTEVDGDTSRASASWIIVCFELCLTNWCRSSSLRPDGRPDRGQSLTSCYQVQNQGNQSCTVSSKTVPSPNTLLMLPSDPASFSSLLKSWIVSPWISGFEKSAVIQLWLFHGTYLQHTFLIFYRRNILDHFQTF